MCGAELAPPKSARKAPRRHNGGSTTQWRERRSSTALSGPHVARFGRRGGGAGCFGSGQQGPASAASAH